MRTVGLLLWPPCQLTAGEFSALLPQGAACGREDHEERQAFPRGGEVRGRRAGGDQQAGRRQQIVSGAGVNPGAIGVCVE